MREEQSCKYCLNDRCLLLGLSRAEASFHPEEFAQVIHYEKGQTLFQEDEPVYGYYLICEGAVKLSRHLSGGKKLIITVLGPGDILGLEASSRDHFALEAEALQETRVGFLDRREFSQLVERYPQLATALIERLSEEVSHLQERIRATARQGAQGKLAYLLLQLAESHGREHPKGTLIDLALTREELAEMVGISRETASLTLSEFASRGWTAPQGRKIVVRDREALEALL